MKKILGIAGCCIALLMMLSINGAALENANAVEIPGKIDAKDYTFFSGTDSEATADEGEGSDIFWIKNNDWFSYTINVERDGMYRFYFHFTSNADSGKVLFLSNEAALSEKEFVNTGDSGSLQTVTDTYLRKGQHTVYLMFQSDDTEGMFSLSHMTVSEVMPEMPFDSDFNMVITDSEGHRAAWPSIPTSHSNFVAWHQGEISIMSLTCNSPSMAIQNDGWNKGNVYLARHNKWHPGQRWTVMHKSIDRRRIFIKLRADGFEDGYGECCNYLDASYYNSWPGGSNVQIWDHDNSKNQMWVFYRTAQDYGKDIFYIKTELSHRFLDRAWASCEEGTNVQVYDFNGSSAQLWHVYKSPKQTGY